MWIYLHQSLCFHILIGENQLLFNGKKDCSSNPLGAPLAHHYIFFPVWKAMPNAPGFKRFSRLSLWDADRSHLVTISKGCLPFSSKAKWAQHWIYIYIYQLHKLLHFSWVACPNHQLLGIHKFIKFLGCLCGVGEPQYVFQTPNVFCYKKKHPVFFPRSSIIRFVKKETAWVFPSLVANFPMIHPVFRLCYIFMSPLSNITETGGGSFNHHGRGQFWQIPPFKV